MRSYHGVEPLSFEKQQFSFTILISVSIISAFGMVFAGGLILQYFKYSLLKSSVKLISAEYSLQFFAFSLAVELESVATVSLVWMAGNWLLTLLFVSLCILLHIALIDVFLLIWLVNFS